MNIALVVCLLGINTLGMAAFRKEAHLVANPAKYSNPPQTKQYVKNCHEFVWKSWKVSLKTIVHVKCDFPLREAYLGEKATT